MLVISEMPAPDSGVQKEGWMEHICFSPDLLSALLYPALSLGRPQHQAPLSTGFWLGLGDRESQQVIGKRRVQGIYRPCFLLWAAVFLN